MVTTVKETFIPVGSSNIAAISYDPDEQEMTVEFQSGDIYVYSDVPVEVYTRWCQAGGRGSYFYYHIRDYYSYEQQ